MADKGKGKQPRKGIRGSERGPNRPAPAMHIHQPHLVHVVSISANGRNATAHAHTITTAPPVPAYGEEDFATNAAVESADFSYDLGDTLLAAEFQEPETDGIVLMSKKKVYDNSVYIHYYSFV
jgi:hypothetical protein